MRAALAGLALLASCAARADDWSSGDKELLTVALATLAIDWGQSRYIATHVETTTTYLTPTSGYVTTTRITERNPLLGEHPGVGKVNGYFALAMLGTAGLAYALPADKRRTFLWGVTIVETVVIFSNHSAGIRMAF